MGATITNPLKRMGSWVGKSNATVYQAATDGFVLAADNTNANSWDVEGYTDGSNPPTTKRSIAGASSLARGATIEMPVKKKDYWKVENAVSFVYWIPLEP